MNTIPKQTVGAVVNVPVQNARAASPDVTIWTLAA